MRQVSPSVPQPEPAPAPPMSARDLAAATKARELLVEGLDLLERGVAILKGAEKTLKRFGKRMNQTLKDERPRTAPEHLLYEIEGGFLGHLGEPGEVDEWVGVMRRALASTEADRLAEWRERAPDSLARRREGVGSRVRTDARALSLEGAAWVEEAKRSRDLGRALALCSRAMVRARLLERAGVDLASLPRPGLGPEADLLIDRARIRLHLADLAGATADVRRWSKVDSSPSIAARASLVVGEVMLANGRPSPAAEWFARAAESVGSLDDGDRVALRVGQARAAVALGQATPDQARLAGQCVGLCKAVA